MSLKLHLISAPWANPLMPSAQIGALKAYIDSTLGAQVTTQCYSAQFAVTYAAEKNLWPSFFNHIKVFGEASYQILFFEKFLNTSIKQNNRDSLSKYVKQVNKTKLFPNKLSVEDLLLLQKYTDEFIEKEIIPNLSKSSANILGFTLNFNQIYASLYIEKYIEQKIGKNNILFLYGGYFASTPQGLINLKQANASGYVVHGEGEKKLESILSQILSSNSLTNKEGKNNFKFNVEGVVKVSNWQESFDKSETYYSSQISNMTDLPIPNYEEFFSKTNRAFKSDHFFKLSNERQFLPVEGSRGCFAKCDFCSLNAQWRGFRKLSPEEVYKRAKIILNHYKLDSILFLDNVCDAWAERFADLVIQNKDKIFFFMELRAHHPEFFWTKLSVAGLTRVQIGIEALSSPLLKGIGKGTRVIQNLVAQKCLKELGVESASNVIINHPKASLDDVQETRRILNETLHFSIVDLVEFRLDVDSPIFNSLETSERNKLKFNSKINFSGSLSAYLGDSYFKLPKSLNIKNNTSRAWFKLKNWYEKKVKNIDQTKYSLNVSKQSNGNLIIVDLRGRQKKKIILKGVDALIYNACHEGPTIELLEKRLKIDPKQIKQILSSLTEKKLTLRVDNHYLSLALRSKNELLTNYYEKLI